jgi:hypothetical protein
LTFGGEIKKLKIEIIDLVLNKHRIKIKKTTGLTPVVCISHDNIC